MIYKKNKYNQNIIEEIANSFSHGLGFILSIIGFIILISISNDHNDPWRMIGYTIYGVSLMCLYFISTLYHAITNSRTKLILRRLDHSAIYVLIAGTYTPVLLISFRDSWVVFLLPIIWIMACIGIYIKLFYLNKYEKLSIIFYVIMGWLAIVAIKPLYISIPFESFGLIFLGGICYTAGIIFYIWDHLPYQHTIWHIFVLMGSFSHYLGILYI